jgi:hypothetical protein
VNILSIMLRPGSYISPGLFIFLPFPVEFHPIQSNCNHHPKVQIQSTYKSEVLFDPQDLGGANLRHLITQEGIRQTTNFLRHWRNQTLVGKLLQSTMARYTFLWECPIQFWNVSKFLFLVRIKSDGQSPHLFSRP